MGGGRAGGAGGRRHTPREYIRRVYSIPPCPGRPASMASQASGSIRGRATHASPAWIAISAGSGWDRKNGIDSVAPYAPTSRIATRSPGSGRAIAADCANTSSPEHSGPATGHREALRVGACRSSRRPR